MRSKVIHPSLKEIAEEYTSEVWNQKDFAILDKLVDPEIVIHSLLGDFRGLKALKEVIQVWLKGFPDLTVSNGLVIAENDLVSMQWQAKGTHRGEFKGRKPSGKSVLYSGVTIYRIKDGKIVEYWAYIDMQHLLSQIE